MPSIDLTLSNSGPRNRSADPPCPVARSVGIGTATLEIHRAHWRDFESWCVAKKSTSLPSSAATVALYVSHLSERLAMATIEQKLATIARAHRSAGCKSLEPHSSGARNRQGCAPRTWRGASFERPTSHDGHSPHGHQLSHGDHWHPQSCSDPLGSRWQAEGANSQMFGLGSRLDRIWRGDHLPAKQDRPTR